MDDVIAALLGKANEQLQAQGNKPGGAVPEAQPSLYQNVPMSEALPFGAGATPEGSPTALSNMVTALMGLPKRAVDASKADVAHYAENGLDKTSQTVGPATETAMALMGTAAPAAEAGAAGIFGGKLAKTANLEKLSQAQRLSGKGLSQEAIMDSTGWFRGPDKQWRFEIPDQNSTMVRPNDWNVAGNMFHHPELYKAYPDLKHVGMYSEVDAGYPAGSGSWSPRQAIIELSSPNAKDARLGALHEMQHVVQNIEGFAPGTTQQELARIQQLNPQMWKSAEEALGTPQTPFDMYNRASGEVEARNVEHRADFNNRSRMDIFPWQSQDIPAQHQLLTPIKPYDLIKALKGEY